MNAILSYAETNRQRFVDDLVEFLKIPSVSARTEHKKDVELCAEYLAEVLKRIGIPEVKVHRTQRHPIVYGERIESSEKPTVLIYGHYDVQPVEPLHEWMSKPFEPVVKENQVYARGATDDKGQFYTHVKAMESFLSVAGSMPVNVKIVIEGEEEVGSDSLYPFIESNREMLSCDVILISDNPMFAKGIPSIGYGLRGLVYAEIEVTGCVHDLHSGTYGGAVPNPANELMNIIASLKNPAGQITIPGFYRDVAPLSDEERATIASLPFDEKTYLKRLGAPMLFGEKNCSTLERIWARPTLDVNGLYGGYMQEGAKTVIPSRATAKLSMRIVPNQTEEKIFGLFRDHVLKIAPPWVRAEVRSLSGGEPFITPVDSPEMQAALRGMEKGFGAKPVFIREGGSIPIVHAFRDTLGRAPILIGYGLPDENTHAPNEHFDLDNYHHAILSNIHIYQELAG